MGRPRISFRRPGADGAAGRMMALEQQSASKPVTPPTTTPAPRGHADPPVARRLLVPLLVVLLLGQMAVAMVTTAVRQTPTIDEPVYVGTAAE